MRCSLNFRGNLAPTMEWRHQRRNGDMESRVITQMVENEFIPNTNISSTLTVIINGTYNASIFTCKTYFQWDNTSSTNSTATNAPDYSYTWNSSAIFVSSRKLVQKKTATASATTSIITSEESGSCKQLLYKIGNNYVENDNRAYAQLVDVKQILCFIACHLRNITVFFSVCILLFLSDNCTIMYGSMYMYVGLFMHLRTCTCRSMLLHVCI